MFATNLLSMGCVPDTQQETGVDTRSQKPFSREVLTLVGESWVTVTRMEGCLADMASEPFLVSCQSSNLELTLSWHQTLLSILPLCDFTFSVLTYSMLAFVICLWACRGSRWRTHHFLTFNRAWYMCVLKYLFEEWVSLRGGSYVSVSGAPRSPRGGLILEWLSALKNEARCAVENKNISRPWVLSIMGWGT